MTEAPATDSGGGFPPATPQPLTLKPEAPLDLVVDPEAIPAEITDRILERLSGGLTDAQVKEILTACREFTLHRDQRAVRAAALWRIAQIALPLVRSVLVPLA